MKLRLLALALLFAVPLAAQDRPSAAIEGFGGWAGFIDNATVHHSVAGAGARFYVTERLAFGPEFTYMRGPGNDRDVFLTGNLTFDFRSGRNWTPFVVAGGGFTQNRDRFPAGTVTHTEGAFTTGGGARFRLTDRVYTAVDARFGWELHVRTTGALGIRLGP